MDSDNLGFLTLIIRDPLTAGQSSVRAAATGALRINPTQREREREKERKIVREKERDIERLRERQREKT